MFRFTKCGLHELINWFLMQSISPCDITSFLELKRDVCQLFSFLDCMLRCKNAYTGCRGRKCPLESSQTFACPLNQRIGHCIHAYVIVHIHLYLTYTNQTVLACLHISLDDYTVCLCTITPQK